MMKTEKIGNTELTLFGKQPDKVYCEGTEEEETVLRVFRDGEDRMEVLKKDNRWPILYQLSPMRGNIVKPMRLNPETRVLEIGAGMGAVTEAVTSRCKSVDCVDLSYTRCMANAYRNQTKSNVRIFCGDAMQFEPEEPYDVVLLIGVLEYAAVYCPGENPFLNLLEFCHRCLKPGGLLYIAIENRIGMKYLAGCKEDHIGKEFVGITGYLSGEGARTFTRSELTELTEKAGFGSHYYYYPLPDYKLPIVIYSDDYLPDESLNIPPYSNYDAGRLETFSDVLALKSLKGTEEFKMLANSFLLEIQKQ